MNDSPSMPEAAVSFLQQLRSGTNDSHKRLESLPISRSIVAESLTLHQYGSYLNLMHDVVRDTEAVVFPKISPIISDLPQRSKIVALKSDLQAIGFTLRQSGTALDREMSVAFALGVMYVVEGSSLGGRVILKNIEKTLGFSGENGAEYFHGYGNTTGSQWSKFLEMLTGYELAQGQSDQIIAGATFAFDAIHEHLSSFENAD